MTFPKPIEADGTNRYNIPIPNASFGYEKGAAMRCKSEETMEQIKNAVEEFYFSHYRSPSIGELAAEVGYAKSTVHSYLWEMDRRGLLSYNGKTAETAVTRKANAEVVLTPVLGSISCGEPE